MVKVRRREQAGVCAALDVAPGSDSLRYFNGCCAECVAAGRRPGNRSSVTSSWPVCLTKLTGRSSQKRPGTSAACGKPPCFQLSLFTCCGSKSLQPLDLGVCGPGSPRRPGPSLASPESVHEKFPPGASAKLVSVVIRLPARTICPGGRLWRGFNTWEKKKQTKA